VNDLFLGLIAAAVVIMAAIQIAAVVFAVRAARRVGDAVSRLEQHVKPIVADLQAVTSQAARATSIAVAQVERADQLITDLSKKVEETAAALQSSLIRPAREGFAVMQGIIAAVSAFKAPSSARGRAMSTEEEDPLFIG
jgi:hypothetical protein